MSAGNYMIEIALCPNSGCLHSCRTYHLLDTPLYAKGYNYYGPRPLTDSQFTITLRVGTQGYITTITVGIFPNGVIGFTSPELSPPHLTRNLTAPF
jgi:hypothetical protein